MRAAARIVAWLDCLLVLAALTAPALALRGAGERGGLPATGVGDVLAVSVGVGVAAAVLTWRRLGAAERSPGRWGGELAFLASLAPLAAGIPMLTLHSAARLPAEFLTLPGLVPAAWGGSLVVAVLAAAGIRRAVTRGLRPVPHSDSPPVPADDRVGAGTAA